MSTNPFGLSSDTAGDAPEPATGEGQLISLPDGRELMCPRRQDALMLWREIFDQEVYAAAARLLTPGSCVLDVGAHVGLSAMYFAGQAEDITLFAFEPARILNTCLRHNLARYVPSATVLRKAVGSKIGRRAFGYYANSPSQSGIYADASADAELTRAYLRNEGLNEQDIDFLCTDLHIVQQEMVEVTTISDVLREQRIEHVDLMKIDAERAELDVLLGITDDDWPRIRSVVMEVHDVEGRLRQCVELLESAGFTVLTQQESWLADSELHTLHALRT
jgi:FkbM family methyltransferase